MSGVLDISEPSKLLKFIDIHGPITDSQTSVGGVGGITVQYLARLYSVAMVPTAIPHSLL